MATLRVLNPNQCYCSECLVLISAIGKYQKSCQSLRILFKINSPLGVDLKLKALRDIITDVTLVTNLFLTNSVSHTIEEQQGDQQ